MLPEAPAMSMPSRRTDPQLGGGDPLAVTAFVARSGAIRRMDATSDSGVAAAQACGEHAVG
jgi:hypothetical protein